MNLVEGSCEAITGSLTTNHQNVQNSWYWSIW